MLGIAPQTLKNQAIAGLSPCRLTPGGQRRFEEGVIRQWAAIRRGPDEPGARRSDGWRRSADALLSAAIDDLGAGTDAAAPFRAALLQLRD